MITSKEQLIKEKGTAIKVQNTDAVLRKLNKLGYVWNITEGDIENGSADGSTTIHIYDKYICHSSDSYDIKAETFFSWFATEETKTKSEDVMSITKEELIKRLDDSVVHCDSVELSDKVLNYFSSLFIKVDIVPFYFGVNTCYSIHCGDVVFGDLDGYKVAKKEIVTAKEFLSWFDVEKEELAAPDKKPLNKREQILKNKDDIEKWYDNATTCFDKGNQIAKYSKQLGYDVKEEMTPEEALKVANWIINLEKVVK
jgi:hypothetical protein